MSYTDLAAALARAKERSGATAANDEFLTEILNLSAGKDAAGATHYRPMYVAADFLEQNRALQALDEAKGVKFTRQGHDDRQPAKAASLDRCRARLTVPPGFEALPSAASSRRYASRSLPTQVRP
jgi:hypothetical protein